MDDEYLKTLILDGASAKVCDYCGRRSRTDIACSIEVLVEAVASTLNAYWNHANDERIPYESREGGFQGLAYDTDES